MFSCLLVCRSAIFIDSKRDGTGAAHGRKGFRMKRAELDRRIANGETLDDIVPALMDDGADITSYDDLKRFAIEKIESDELYLAEHVLKACLDVADYYGYDYSMGTLEKPTAIQGEIAIRSYDSTGITIEHYLGDAEEFYPDEHPQILEREVGYIFPLMEVEPTICIELKNEEDEG